VQAISRAISPLHKRDQESGKTNGTLQSADQSLVNISSLSNILTNQLDPLGSLAATQASTTSQTGVTGQDSVQVSKTAEFFQQLRQLETQNPAEFKKELSDIAGKLKTAAQQESDPSQSSFLNNLADRFQKAADTGDLSALKPPQANQAASGHNGHHHHGSSGLSAQTQETLATIFQDAENALTARSGSTPATV
jgi:hypothetical protein